MAQLTPQTPQQPASDPRKQFGIGDVLMTYASGGLWPVAKYGKIALQDMRAETNRRNQLAGQKQMAGQIGGIQQELLKQYGMEGQDFYQAAAQNPALQQAFAAQAGTVQGYNPGLLGQLWQQQAARQASKQQREALGGYQTLSQKINTMSGLSKDAAKSMQPYRNTLSAYENMRTIHDSVKGDLNNISGAQDQALIKFVQKMILPNEAVMSDDQIAVVKNSGLWQQVDQMRKWLTAEKGAGLGVGARRQLFQLANQLRGEAVNNLEMERTRFNTLAQQAQFTPEQVYQKRQWGGNIPLGAQPPALPPGVPPGAVPYTGRIER